MSKLKAKLVIVGAWDKPQVGTPNQHRAITKLAQKLGYDSMIEFLRSWHNYEKAQEYSIEKDGSIRPLQAHWIFLAHRNAEIAPKGSKPWGVKKKE